MPEIDMSGDGLSMTVIKRDGRREDVEFDKILTRIRNAGDALTVNHALVAKKVIDGIYDGVTTRELDEQAALICTNMSTHHPDYGRLAANIIISNHQKNTAHTFAEAMTLLYNAKDIHGEHSPIIGRPLYDFVVANGAAVEARIQYHRDFLIDYFGFKTLERAYLMRYKNYAAAGSPMTIVERPQHLFMRVAVAIHLGDYAAAADDAARAAIIESMFTTYDITSQKYYTHATPTLYNAGTPRGQLSSCYLLSMQSDSITGIYSTLAESAQVSKYAGGIGIHIHNIRAAGSLIRGTNGISNGLVPMLRVFNDSARYVDQCFTPDTVVFTANGPKQIEDISIADKVLTSNGEFNQVHKPLRHEYTGEMLRIQIKNSIVPIQVTPVHQILALKNQKKGLNFSVIINRLEKGLIELDYYEAKDLTTDDLLAFPIPTYEYDIKYLTEDDCRMYGIMLGDGHISTKTSGVCLNNYSKKEVVQFVLKYCADRNIRTSIIDGKLKSGETVQDKSYKIIWSSASTGFKFIKSQLYNDVGEKRIESAMLHLPLNKVIQIIRGLIETDGCISDKEISIEMTSFNVIESLRYMLLRLGCLTSGNIRDRIGSVSSYREITTRKKTMVMRIPRIKPILELFPTAPKGDYFTFLRHDNFIYSRVETVEVVKYSGIVHDFEIDTVHDYTVAHLGVVHNGGGKRPGSIAMYLEPWHADILDFLELKLSVGNEERRARDLFYALWIPDLFMERLAQAVAAAEVGEDPDAVLWTLMCPNECPGLADVWGPAFKELYEKYESTGKGRKSIPILQIWNAVIKAQIETGTPYLCYKDAANAKSNQQNLGTIKSSNLCVAPETRILTDEGERVISELVGQNVRVWNGDCWSNTTVIQTGMNQELMKITVSVNGAQHILECTPYHKFIMYDGSRVEAQNIDVGDQLCRWYDNDVKQYDSVIESIEYTGRCDETYCFNEPLKRAGVFNGILTGNCSEIIEYSSPTETAVCNLASVCLPMFIKADKTYDYDYLRQVVSVIVRNLDRVIDINFYPTENTSRSNFRHRPIGIGVQGLADTFAIMKMAFDSPEARELNRRIFAHMYYAAVETSAAVARERGTYASFAGSPASEGRLQFDLWGVEPLADPALDWDALRAVARGGLRNSLLMAPMPTASTSQILKNNEAFEPFTSNIYTRNTSAGNFIIINQYLIRELIDAGIWSPEVRMALIAAKGSIQGIAAIPDAIKVRYKTVWETKQRVLIDMAADRGAYICQSQSLNLFVAAPTPAILTSMHLYSWRQGLKTGIYYLRTLPKSDVQQFTVEPVKKGVARYESDDESDAYDSEEEAGEGAVPVVKPLLTDKEKRKAKLRAAIAAGTYDSGEGQCTNCGS